MRGKVYNSPVFICNVGITPAYAGKSRWYVRTAKIFLGSPPPMRGKDGKTYAIDESQRITPAYAGKRYLACIEVAKIQDHPRLCGEKLMIDLSVSWVRGSPPPMRGKVPTVPRIAESYRITPAYAGKRVNALIWSRSIWDHPRLCGEKRFSKNCGHVEMGITPAYAGKSAQNRTTNTGQLGSPPPMRGKVSYDFVLPVPVRITPAYAGKRCT